MNERQRDVDLAQSRLGHSESRLAWILDEFMVHDPTALSTGERSMWRDNFTDIVLSPRAGGPPRMVTMYEEDPLRKEIGALQAYLRPLTECHRASVEMPELN